MALFPELGSVTFQFGILRLYKTCKRRDLQLETRDFVAVGRLASKSGTDII